MKTIIISQQIKKAAPLIELGILESSIKFSHFNENLWEEIAIESERVKQISTEEIKQIASIESTRETYKNLGKEPSRYRPSAEALHRRIILGKEMYKISTPVDIINLTSLKTGYSIGGYDLNKIQGEVIFDTGKSQTEYQAIGRGIMNIESLPVFYDKIGAFGSPTSDSLRTMISEDTKNILLIIMNFGGHKKFEEVLIYMSELLKKYCSAENMKTTIIR